ncbi:hypothetical protein NUM_34970 [Actinocatenispora comari]|jgi:hypothetical protein|uniref:Uncharacterized protein n=1 Tax=Actinocatenispora comari TaxID=2807577 RepID=A0A8J4AC39_9ACTN|nr:hypothetical protein NUM_34970 [Actinocatenispora comari]
MLPRTPDGTPGSGDVPTRRYGGDPATTRRSGNVVVIGLFAHEHRTLGASPGSHRHHPTPYRPGQTTAAVAVYDAAGSLMLRVCRRVVDARALSAGRQAPIRTDQD